MVKKRKKSRRASLRYKFHDFEIRYMAKGVLGRGKLLNISLGGCSVASISDPVETGQDILVAVEFENLERPLECKGKVLRAQDDAFSASFFEIDAPEGTNLSTLFAQGSRNSFAVAEPET